MPKAGVMPAVVLLAALAHASPTSVEASSTASGASQATAREAQRPLFTAVDAAVLRSVPEEGPDTLRRRFVRADPSRLGGSSDAVQTRPRGTLVVLDLFEDVALIASQERVHRNPLGSYSWSGDLLDDPGGHVNLVVDGGVVVGGVRHGDDYYRIRHVGRRLHVVELVDPSFQIPSGRDALLPPAVERGRPRLGSEIPERGSTTIDVLAVYTEAARNAAGGTSGIQAEFQAAIDDTNAAIDTVSGAPGLSITAYHEVDYDEYANSHSATLDHLRNDGDGNMDEVHDLRSSYGADLVALLVEDWDSAAGIAWIAPFSASYAFSVSTRRWAAGPNYVLAHELGHNMGASHDRYVSSWSVYDYSFAFVHIDGGNSFRTIMAYSDECSDNGVSCTRVRAFSSPVHTYNAVAMGVAEGEAEAADNRLTFNNTAGSVAGFYSPGAGPAAPGPPSNLAVSSSGSAATLSWSAPSSGGTPTDYVVEIGTSSGASDHSTQSTSGTSLGVSGFADGTYYARVKARNGAGTSAPTGDTPFTISSGPSVPGAPSGLTATVSDQQVTLQWNAAAGSVNDYVVYVSTSSGGADVLATSTGATAYVMSGLAAGSYFARVHARNDVGTGASSGEVTFTVEAPATEPGAPGGLGSSVHDTRVEVGWSAPTSGGPPSEYRIEMGISAGGADYRTAVTDSLTHAFLGVDPGTYYLRVTASNSVGDGPATADVTATVDEPIAEPPASPRSLRTNVAGSWVSSAWDHPTNGAAPTSYTVELGTTAGAADAAVSTITETSNGFPGIPDGLYFLRVIANNDYGSSAATDDRLVTVGTGAGSTPGTAALESPKGTVEDTAPDFVWSPASHASDYELTVADNKKQLGAATYAAADICASGECLAPLLDGLTLSPGVDYTWSVRATNAFGEGDWKSLSFDLVRTAPREVTVLRPLSGTNAAWPPLQWWHEGMATEYEIDVSQGQGRAATITVAADDVCTDAGDCFVIGEEATVGPLVNGAAEWSIRGVNDLGTGDWTSTSFNVIAGRKPSKPKLSSPRNGVETDAHPVHRWRLDEFANVFELHLRDGATGETSTWTLDAVQYCLGPTDCALTWSDGGLASGTYEWWVVARKEVGARGRSSKVRKLTVVASVGEDGGPASPIPGH